MMAGKKILLILLLVLYFPLPVFAETILLKSGKIVEGEVIKKDDKCMQINSQGVLLTYYRDEIASIDGKPADLFNKKVVIDIPNPEYLKPPRGEDNIDIGPESTVGEILKKTNYYYATHNFDKAIELCKLALEKTNDRQLLAKIYYSLSANYLEEGIGAYAKNKDDSYYQLSLQCSRKVLEVFPDSWKALSNIAAVYLNTRDWKKAVFYYSEAEKYLDKRDINYIAIETERKIAEEMIKRG
jgi:tetratricopeptide (TPR) repeat protein